MSRLYDTVEPTVIDEALLRECVEEQGPKGEAGKIAKKEGIDFEDVLQLRLDYRSMYMYSSMCYHSCWSDSLGVILSIDIQLPKFLLIFGMKLQ